MTYPNIFEANHERCSRHRAYSDTRLSAGPIAGICAVLVLVLVCTPAAAQLSTEDIQQLREQGEKEGWTFEVGVNGVTHIPLDQLCGLVEPPDWREKGRSVPCTPRRDLPSEFNWRTLGGCTSVKYQGGCGSCWAFGAVGAVESTILINDGLNLDLSEQWLVSCTNAGSCWGGWHHDAFEKMRCSGGTDYCGDSGAVLEEDFPYTSSQASCGCPYPHPYCIESWAFVGTSSSTPPTANLKQAILDYGPISVAVAVNDAFHAYNGGIFNSCSATNINHAVVLVGWDDNQGDGGVWIMRNSWGSWWGESGYMRIPYACARIGYAAAFVEYAAADCNGNGIKDKEEIAAGSATDCNDNNVIDQCEIGVSIVQDFSGSVGTPYNLNGNAQISSQSALLTPAENGRQGAVILLGDTTRDTRSFTADFDFRIGGGTGADGMSFSAMNALHYYPMADFGETGPGPNALTLEFDTYANSGENDNHLSLWYNGSEIAQYSPTFNLNNDQWHHAQMIFSDQQVTVVLTPSGQSQEVAFNDVTLPGFQPAPFLYGFGARTGGMNDAHRVDNIWIDYTTYSDCNANTIVDDCDIARNTSDDCNGDKRPDECDLAAGTADDCNANQTLDECDISRGHVGDCDKNGVPDACDVMFAGSDDCNENLIPDQCDPESCYSLFNGFENLDAGTIMDGMDLNGDGFAWSNPSTTARIYYQGCPGRKVKINGMTTEPFSDRVETEYFRTYQGRMPSIARRSSLSFNLRSELNLDAPIDWQLTIRDAADEVPLAMLHLSSTQSSHPSLEDDSQRGKVLVANPGDGPELLDTGYEIPVNTCYSVRIELDNSAPTDQAVRVYIDDVLRVTTAPLHDRADRMDYIRIDQVYNWNYDDQLTRLGLDSVQLCLSGAEAIDGDLPDCNANGIFDECDIHTGLVADCNANRIPDECEVLTGGDLDGDGDLDVSDYHLFVECMNTGPCGSPPCSPAIYSDPCCGPADLDFDGDVDTQDFALFQQSLAP